jgi:transcriptional regulator with GAF, ATPase, and Fis domain
MRQLGKRLPDHQKILSIMELILENFKRQNPVAGRIEVLKTLTKLLLYEVESLAEISPAKTNQPPNETISLNDQVQRYEIDLICKALVSVKGNQSKAAKMLGMNPTTLHAKLRRYDIDALSFIGQFSADEDLVHKTE